MVAPPPAQAAANVGYQQQYANEAKKNTTTKESAAFNLPSTIYYICVFAVAAIIYNMLTSNSFGEFSNAVGSLFRAGASLLDFIADNPWMIIFYPLIGLLGTVLVALIKAHGAMTFAQKTGWLLARPFVFAAFTIYRLKGVGVDLVTQIKIKRTSNPEALNKLREQLKKNKYKGFFEFDKGANKAFVESKGIIFKGSSHSRNLIATIEALKDGELRDKIMRANEELKKLKKDEPLDTENRDLLKNDINKIDITNADSEAVKKKAAAEIIKEMKEDIDKIKATSGEDAKSKEIENFKRKWGGNIIEEIDPGGKAARKTTLFTVDSSSKEIKWVPEYPNGKNLTFDRLCANPGDPNLDQSQFLFDLSEIENASDDKLLEMVEKYTKSATSRQYCVEQSQLEMAISNADRSLRLEKIANVSENIKKNIINNKGAAGLDEAVTSQEYIRLKHLVAKLNLVTIPASVQENTIINKIDELAKGNPVKFDDTILARTAFRQNLEIAPVMHKLQLEALEAQYKILVPSQDTYKEQDLSGKIASLEAQFQAAPSVTQEDAKQKKLIDTKIKELQNIRDKHRGVKNEMYKSLALLEIQENFDLAGDRLQQFQRVLGLDFEAGQELFMENVKKNIKGKNIDINTEEGRNNLTKAMTDAIDDTNNVYDNISKFVERIYPDKRLYTDQESPEFKAIADFENPETTLEKKQEIYNSDAFQQAKRQTFIKALTDETETYSKEVKLFEVETVNGKIEIDLTQNPKALGSGTGDSVAVRLANFTGLDVTGGRTDNAKKIVDKLKKDLKNSFGADYQKLLNKVGGPDAKYSLGNGYRNMAHNWAKGRIASLGRR